MDIEISNLEIRILETSFTMEQMSRIIHENTITNNYIKMTKDVDEEVIKSAQVKLDVMLNSSFNLLLETNNNLNQICENVILNDHMREHYREMYDRTLSQRNELLNMINFALVITQDQVKDRPVVYTLVNSINQSTRQIPIFPEEEVYIKPRMNADREALIDAYTDPEIAYYVEHTKTGRQLRNRFIPFE